MTKYVRKKRAIRRRKVYRKRAVVYKSLVKARKEHYFTRYSVLDSAEFSAVAGYKVGLSFRLADLPGDTEFTGLFDQYMIRAVKVMFYPVGLGQMPIVPSVDYSKFRLFGYSIIDYDDDNVATLTLPAMRQYETCRMFNPTRNFSIYLKPKYNTEVSVPLPNTVGYAPRRGYLSTENDRIRHYGVKIIIDESPQLPPSDFKFFFRIEAKYYLSFRNVK